jgi:hemerythrin-like domain-containing protein
MASSVNNNNLPGGFSNHPRREFLKRSTLLGTLTCLSGLGLVSGCSKTGAYEIGPAELLMTDHGLLNRIMMIYDACRTKLIAGESFPADALQKAARLIRIYIEDYHEKLEEEFLFPRFVNADKLVGLNQLLYIQHSTGKKVTDQILALAGSSTLTDPDNTRKLTELLNTFNWMYRSHESREDTVLFPALRSIVSKKEYYAIGEEFNKRAANIFGQDGFEATLAKAEAVEKQLGINDMAKLTPAMPM